jgi:hypothetical protein
MATSELLDQIVNQLYLGHHVTLVSFPDDGLESFYTPLAAATRVGDSYDPGMHWCAISFQALSSYQVVDLEAEINISLKLESGGEADIVSVLSQGKQLIVFADDLDEMEQFAQIVQSVDGLVKRYKRRVQFVYIIEDPLFVTHAQSAVSSYSYLLDTVIFKRIGSDIAIDSVVADLDQKYRTAVATQQLAEIKTRTNGHYGLIRKLYRDNTQNTNQLDLYLDTLVQSFDPAVLNVFKKIVASHQLNASEAAIASAYQQVNFLNSEMQITIPLLHDRILQAKVRGKLEYDASAGKITGLDLDLLTKAERSIIEQMLVRNNRISKEELGDILWGADVNKYYSEWAIDQRISRLKKKINELGFPIQIKTVYGQGYKIELS